MLFYSGPVFRECQYAPSRAVAHVEKTSCRGASIPTPRHRREETRIRRISACTERKKEAGEEKRAGLPSSGSAERYLKVSRLAFMTRAAKFRERAHSLSLALSSAFADCRVMASRSVARKRPTVPINVARCFSGPKTRLSRDDFQGKLFKRDHNSVVSLTLFRLLSTIVTY